MMRRIITTLLALVLTLSTTPARASARDGEETKITPEEEREARALVGEFNKQFVATQDIGPLVKEYFVPDFAPRLNRHAETFPFQLIRRKDGAAPPDAEDLLRFYVASTNCLQSLFPLMYESYKKVEKERGGDGERRGPKLEEIFPPEAVGLIKSDPLLRAAWEAGGRPDDATESSTPDAAFGGGSPSVGEAPEKKSEELMIDDAEKLRHLTSVLEGVSKILREHLAAHPVTFEKAEKRAGEASEEGDGAASFDPEKIAVYENARVLRQEFYGYPEGTRLVCADAGALHVEMVRVDGRLRILTVFLLMDD